MIIVTSGNRYIDIDAYASCIAYANLLNLKGFNAKAVSTAKLNESITDSLIKLPEKIEKHYVTTGNEKYIILDVSDKNFFDNIVIENNIIEIIDHHYGYENYWNKKLKEHSHIEKIGSIATFIFELYEKEQLIDKISNGMAKLLISAILDNTLNLKAQSTTKRDIFAYEKLLKLSGIKSNYNEIYFKECQKKISSNLIESIKNDTKIEIESNLLPNIFSQLLFWDGKDFLKNKLIYNTLDGFGSEWMINIISLKDNASYLISKDIKVQKNLETLFNKKFESNIMKLNKIWLRKEIIRKAGTKAKKEDNS